MASESVIMSCDDVGDIYYFTMEEGRKEGRKCFI